MARYRYAKSEDELKEELREQAGFLRDSMAAYDAGKEAEAKRLATVASTLCRDGARGTSSLLGQLGLRSKTTWLSTADNPENRGVPNSAVLTGANFSLCQFQWVTGPEGTLKYVPRGTGEGLFGPPREISFHDWWEETVFFGRKVPTLSRKNLICSLRDQHGGSHVDAELTDESYHAAATGAFGMMMARPDQPDLNTTNGHLASMRQIATELDIVLTRLGY